MKNLNKIYPIILNEALINDAVNKYNIIRNKDVIKLYQIYQNQVIAHWYYIGICDYTKSNCYLRYDVLYNEYDISFIANSNYKYLSKNDYLITEQELKKLQNENCN